MTAPLDSIRLPAGALLFAEGEAGSCAYLVNRGCIEIYLSRDDGEVILGSSGPGEIIGEMAILDNRPRSASARVIADCELVLISAKQIAYRIAESDPILQMLLKIVLTRYRETLERINEGTSREARMSAQPPVDGFAAQLGTLALESELRRALQNDEFELFFQPIVRLPSRRLAGFEALLRWRHPSRGYVSPGEFIPIAEACGLIVEITDWCLGQVGRIFPEIMTAALHNVAEVEPLFLSLNVSGYDLVRASFVGAVTAMLQTSGIEPGSIKLEVTESVLMKQPEKAMATLEALQGLGLGIAIDDFGTGYSSLSYLSSLPITTIKIDQSFVRSMTRKPASRKIIHMILRLAEELDIPVVAEGIEQAEEERMLADFGCSFGQGYLFSKPLPLAETLMLTRHWRSLDRGSPVLVGAKMQKG
jgi:EAL domain-containing protein (putative c-di-GMP-specific phosphodiesterase class I)